MCFREDLTAMSAFVRSRINAFFRQFFQDVLNKGLKISLQIHSEQNLLTKITVQGCNTDRKIFISLK